MNSFILPFIVSLAVSAGIFFALDFALMQAQGLTLFFSPINLVEIFS